MSALVIDVLLEATSKDVDVDLVRKHILEAPGARAAHDLRVWTITSGPMSSRHMP